MNKAGEKLWWLSWWQSTPSKSEREDPARGKEEANTIGFKKMCVISSWNSNSKSVLRRKCLTVANVADVLSKIKYEQWHSI